MLFSDSQGLGGLSDVLGLVEQHHHDGGTPHHRRGERGKRDRGREINPDNPDGHEGTIRGDTYW